MALNAKQKAFCRDYALYGNASKAAREAGYSVKTAYSQGWDLLRKPEVKKEIERIKAKSRSSKEELAQILWDRTESLATFDIGELVTWDGESISIKEFEGLPKEVRVCIASFEVIKRKEPGSKAEIERIKLKFHDPNKAQDRLKSMLGMDQDQANAADKLADAIRRLK